MSWWDNPSASSKQAEQAKARPSPQGAALSADSATGASADSSAAFGAAAGPAAAAPGAAAVTAAPSAAVSPIKSYVIRMAALSDCSAIARLELASAQFEHRLAPIGFSFEELRTLWRKRIASGEFYVLLAEGQVAASAPRVALQADASGGATLVRSLGPSAATAGGYCTYDGTGHLSPLSSQLLGFVGLTASLGRDAFIQAIYIAPAFYRMGLGSALLQAAEKIMRQRGCGRVVLYVEPFNRMGHSFYRKMGFYQLNRKHHHLDILVKELSSC